jgi:iron complex outermembrane receptor protein
VDVQGSPAAGLNLVLTYAYTDARQTRSADSTLPNGRLPGAPLHAGSFWSTYRVTRGSLRGLEVGGGLYLSGKTTTTFPATVELPGWQRIDLLVGYEWQRWGAYLRLGNVTDEHYFRGDWQGIAPQAPRTVSGSITARF